ncbi:MAG: hypothetical protein JRK53_06510, partial [Deltaproteobacteria bacterium]|nr:hypothetical protein [Deltaproteobacteria bacterium]
MKKKSSESVLYRLFTIILTISVFVLMAQPAGAAATWQWENPLPQGNHINGIWGASSSNVFAVGELGTILHYNGSKWSVMSSGTTVTLKSVWGSSGTDVFAVGNFGT